MHAKKATTDALTKLLSRLGFNADVFLGLYDDNKYVEQVASEFAAAEKQSAPKITDEQRTELMALCDSTGFPVARFLDVSKDRRALEPSYPPINSLAQKTGSSNKLRKWKTHNGAIQALRCLWPVF